MKDNNNENEEAYDVNFTLKESPLYGPAVGLWRQPGGF